MSGAVDVLAVMDDRVQQGLARADHRRGKAEPLGVIELRQARAAVAELIVRADNAATLLSNMIAARKLDERYADHVTDLTAALARCRGEA